MFKKTLKFYWQNFFFRMSKKDKKTQNKITHAQKTQKTIHNRKIGNFDFFAKTNEIRKSTQKTKFHVKNTIFLKKNSFSSL